MRNAVVIATISMTVAACGSGSSSIGTPLSSTFAESPMLDAVAFAPMTAYRIGPADKLSVTVFQVEDLSREEVFVDTGGSIDMPLLGSVQAAGLTSSELAAELERLLGARYLRNPEVNVSVIESAGQKVTVDGAVTKPGVYRMVGRTTLLQAVAMAEGPTRIADLRKVAIFRTIDGRRAVALFSLADIRRGASDDPILTADDVVVVDTSRLAANMQTFINALPGLSVFAYL
jgi:polysaccharide biosynthesis/export protein